MGVQLVCPKCRYEYQYDNSYYDTNIARLGIEIKTIIDQLAQHKLKPKQVQYNNTEWWLNAKKALTVKQKQLAELKAFRKIADQQRKKAEYEAFKNAVKEICGETIYIKCLEIMHRDIESYNMSDTSRTAYTSADGKGVTSINKL
jgi:ribonuclease D